MLGEGQSRAWKKCNVLLGGVFVVLLGGVVLVCVVLLLHSSADRCRLCCCFVTLVFVCVVVLLHSSADPFPLTQRSFTLQHQILYRIHQILCALTPDALQIFTA